MSNLKSESSTSSGEGESATSVLSDSKDSQSKSTVDEEEDEQKKQRRLDKERKKKKKKKLKLKSKSRSRSRSRSKSKSRSSLSSRSKKDPKMTVKLQKEKANLAAKLGQKNQKKLLEDKQIEKLETRGKGKSKTTQQDIATESESVENKSTKGAKSKETESEVEENVKLERHKSKRNTAVVASKKQQQTLKDEVDTAIDHVKKKDNKVFNKKTATKIQQKEVKSPKRVKPKEDRSPIDKSKLRYSQTNLFNSRSKTMLYDKRAEESISNIINRQFKPKTVVKRSTSFTQKSYIDKSADQIELDQTIKAKDQKPVACQRISPEKMTKSLHIIVKNLFKKKSSDNDQINKLDAKSSIKFTLNSSINENGERFD